jgi:hypothetical protein
MKTHAIRLSIFAAKYTEFALRDMWLCHGAISKIMTV